MVNRWTRVGRAVSPGVGAKLVDYHPITRYGIAGGYTAAGLTQEVVE